MSTREGQAASVTLLRREQLRKVVRPYIPKYRRGAKSQKRADEGIGPYKARRKIVGADRVVHPYKAHREKAHFLFCFCIAKTSPSSEGDV